MGFISDVGFLPQAVATTFGFNDYISWLLPLVTIKQICMLFFFYSVHFAGHEFNICVAPDCMNSIQT